MLGIEGRFCSRAKKVSELKKGPPSEVERTVFSIGQEFLLESFLPKGDCC